MDDVPVSEVLPERYRSVLDAVGDLERAGRRRDAATIRADATHAYSRAWNAATWRRLTELEQRAERILDGGRAASRTRVARIAARVFAA